jgi:hypothetical protein
MRAKIINLVLDLCIIAILYDLNVIITALYYKFEIEIDDPFRFDFK